MSNNTIFEPDKDEAFFYTDIDDDDNKETSGYNSSDNSDEYIIYNRNILNQYENDYVRDSEADDDEEEDYNQPEKNQVPVVDPNESNDDADDDDNGDNDDYFQTQVAMYRRVHEEELQYQLMLQSKNASNSIEFDDEDEPIVKDSQ